MVPMAVRWSLVVSPEAFTDAVCGCACLLCVVVRVLGAAACCATGRDGEPDELSAVAAKVSMCGGRVVGTRTAYEPTPRSQGAGDMLEVFGEHDTRCLFSKASAAPRANGAGT